MIEILNQLKWITALIGVLVTIAGVGCFIGAMILHVLVKKVIILKSSDSSKKQYVPEWMLFRQG